MSDRVPASDDALALRPIDRTLIDTVTLQARDSPRRRAILRYHELPEPVQRMLNGLEPESYVQPHRHATPPKVEVFLVLRGRAMLLRFDDAGGIIEAVEIAAGGPTQGAEVPPGAWHTLFALEPGTVSYEVKQGPYDPATDKEFAPWAPPEADAQAAHAYLSSLRAALRLPPLAAHAPDPGSIAEEEDDLM